MRVRGERGRCRNCRKLIILEKNDYDWYWYHPEGQTIWCVRTDGARTKAEPR